MRARIVDEQVDRAEGGCCVLDGCPLGHVCRDRSAGGKLGGHSLDLVLGAGHDRDEHPGLAQGERELSPDPAPAAGDHRDLALEAHPCNPGTACCSLRATRQIRFASSGKSRCSVYASSEPKIASVQTVAASG